MSPFQLSLFDAAQTEDAPYASLGNRLSVFAWNVQSPSIERARLQAEYILSKNPDIAVLTEIREGKASEFFPYYFEQNGYTAIANSGGRFITLIAVKKKFFSAKEEIEMEIPEGETGRLVSVSVEALGTRFSVFGIYAPANLPDEGRIAYKLDFHRRLNDCLARRLPSGKLLLLGDLNILEPGHLPKFKSFFPFEPAYGFLAENMADCFYLCNTTIDYSWVRSYIKQRLDHAFVTDDLKPRVKSCFYDHDATRLSDHSALVLELSEVCT